MKRIATLLVLALFIAACGGNDRSKMPATGTFGTPIKTDTVKTVSDVLALLETENNIPVVASGAIESYCKGEGCWLALENKGGEPLLVEVAEKAFVLPMNIDGKIATVQGTAVKEETHGKAELKIIATGITIQ